MPIIEKCNDKAGKYYCYISKEEKELKKDSNTLLKIFNLYINTNISFESAEEMEEFKKHIIINNVLVGEIFTRIDKRKEYFIIFHDNTLISDIKEAALIAYWILKFKPFSLDMAVLSKNKYIRICDGFAFYVILSAMKESLNRIDKELKLSDECIDKVLYAFKYWDLSKEALMLIAETLYESLL